MSDFLDRAKDLAAEHSDKLEQGVDVAGDFVDEKTDGKYSDQIDTGQEKAKEFLGGLGDDK